MVRLLYLLGLLLYTGLFVVEGYLLFGEYSLDRSSLRPCRDQFDFFCGEIWTAAKTAFYTISVVLLSVGLASSLFLLGSFLADKKLHLAPKVFYVGVILNLVFLIAVILYRDVFYYTIWLILLFSTLGLLALILWFKAFYRRFRKTVQSD